MAAAGAPTKPAKEGGKVKLRKSVVDRVRALNDGPGLPAPIRLGVVAGPLAALEEAEALAILDAALREADPADPTGDPTAWICRAAAAKRPKADNADKADDAAAGPPDPKRHKTNGVTEASGGVEKVAGAAINGAAKDAPTDSGEAAQEAAPAGEAGGEKEKGADGAAEKPAAPEEPKKVRLKKKVAERIKELNRDGGLAAPLSLGAVAGPLAAIDETAALALLDSLLEAGARDPTSWVCAAAWNAEARAREEEEEWKQWEEREVEKAGELAQLLTAPVLDRIKAINRTVCVADPLVLALIGGPLALLEEKAALGILAALEENMDELESATRWVYNQALWKAGKVLTRVDKLNRIRPGMMSLRARVPAGKVRGPLLAIPESAAMRLLEELEQKALEVEDPTAWIVAEAEKALQGCKLAQTLKAITDRVTFEHPLATGFVLDKLAELGEREAMRIMRDFRAKASTVRKPTGWFLAAMRFSGGRASQGVGPPAPPPWRPPGLQARGKAEAAPAAPAAATEPQKAVKKSGSKVKVDEDSSPPLPKTSPPVAGALATATVGPAPTTPPEVLQTAPSADDDGGGGAVAPPEEDDDEDFDAEAAEQAAWREMRMAFGEEVEEPAAGPTTAQPPAKKRRTQPAAPPAAAGVAEAAAEGAMEAKAAGGKAAGAAPARAGAGGDAKATGASKVAGTPAVAAQNGGPAKSTPLKQAPEEQFGEEEPTLAAANDFEDHEDDDLQ